MMFEQQSPFRFLPTGFMQSDDQFTGGSPGSSTYLGANIAVVTGATLHHDYVFVSDRSWETLTVTCDNLSHLDVTDFPRIARTGGFTGIKDVRVGNDNGKISYRLDFSDVAGAVSKSIASPGTGSYYEYCEQAVLDLLESVGTKHAYISGSRNNGSWWPQLAGIPYSNSSAGGGKNGALITPRHLLGVRHYPLAVGNTVTFLTAANAIETRTVMAVEYGPPNFADTCVCVLNSDLPETIDPLPIVGPWVSYISATALFHSYANQQVGIFLNQHREAGFLEIGYYEEGGRQNPTGTYGGVDMATQVPVTMHFAAALDAQRLPSLNSYRASYQTIGFSGDSGSAVLLPVTGGWAVACCMSSSWGGEFPHEDLLNAMIAAVDATAGVTTGHTVTVAPDPTE